MCGVQLVWGFSYRMKGPTQVVSISTIGLRIYPNLTTCPSCRNAHTQPALHTDGCGCAGGVSMEEGFQALKKTLKLLA